MKKDTVSIVGASAAGVAAARALRLHGFDGRIVLVDSDSRLPYERPPLSKSGQTALTPIAPADFYGYADIELMLGIRVESIDTRFGSVTFDDGTSLNTSKVLLTTGVRARQLSVPGARLGNVLSLRDAADAEVVHARLAVGGPLVVVGGGFIGLELAAVARAGGIDVTVVEMGPLPLAPAVGPVLGRRLTEHHEARGVRVLTNTFVTEFLGDSVIERVTLSDGSCLDAATVVVGVGVEPATELADRVGVRCDGGIMVDTLCRTSADGVFAAGDVASRPHPGGQGRFRLEHWDSAVQHGERAALSMLGVDPGADPVPYFWSEQYELRVQMYGRHERSHTTLHRDNGDNGQLVFWMSNGRVTAVAGVNAAKDIRAAKSLIESGTPVDAEELVDSEVSLRTLARRHPARPRSGL